MVKARNRKTNVKQVVLGAIWLNRIGPNECIHFSKKYNGKSKKVDLTCIAVQPNYQELDQA